MNRLKCEKYGRKHPLDQPCAANDNQPFDEKEWRKVYHMKEYMRKKRERLRARPSRRRH